jgi:hypothetical protein
MNEAQEQFHLTLHIRGSTVILEEGGGGKVFDAMPSIHPFAHLHLWRLAGALTADSEYQQ